ncbi:cation:dicarboxylase symporter family transporter, partial [Gordonibacter pamelaeae]|nr:cation:dicarboxylase symporter family transporter [Gordonibacter pamelaeae]
SNVGIPLLPLFIAATFAGLAYEGSLTRQLPVFLKVIILVLLGHYIWLAVLYSIAGIVSGRNPLEVLCHY